MSALWPWLALAGLGALHGASPASGWMFIAARAAQARRAQGEGEGATDLPTLRALLPMAIGHLASVALVAAVFALGVPSMRWAMQALALALFGAGLLQRVTGRGACRGLARRDAGLALWSFAMSTGHGAGMMLVPALVPLCLADLPARELTASGSVMWAVAAVGVHAASMIAACGVASVAAGRLFSPERRHAASRCRPKCAQSKREDGLANGAAR